jgi:hypothetical protein
MAARLPASLGDLPVDGDAGIGADHRAQGTPRAIVFRIQQYNWPVALAVKFIGQVYYIFGTGISTKLAPLASLYVNYYPTSSHKLSSGFAELFIVLAAD